MIICSLDIFFRVSVVCILKFRKSVRRSYPLQFAYFNRTPHSQFTCHSVSVGCQWCQFQVKKTLFSLSLSASNRLCAPIFCLLQFPFHLQRCRHHPMCRDCSMKSTSDDGVHTRLLWIFTLMFNHLLAICRNWNGITGRAYSLKWMFVCSRLS